MMSTNLKFVSLLDHDISSVSFPMRRLKMVKPVLTPPAIFSNALIFASTCFELPTLNYVKYKNITKCKMIEQNHKTENFKTKTKNANIWCHANLCYKDLMLNWSAKNSACRSNRFSLILELWLLRGVSVASARVTHATWRAHRLSSPAFSSDP